MQPTMAKGVAVVILKAHLMWFSNYIQMTYDGIRSVWQVSVKGADNCLSTYELREEISQLSNSIKQSALCLNVGRRISHS